MNAEQFENKSSEILGNISIDCVVFGFNNGVLKVLLVNWKETNSWILPGGFIHLDESIEESTKRVLKDRTGLSDIYLKQFEVFGKCSRNFRNEFTEHFRKVDIEIRDEHWVSKRYVSVGYYALVDFKAVELSAENDEEGCAWKDINDCPILSFDHAEILHSALKALRFDFITQHIGLRLLPREFTMNQVQDLYESFLNAKYVRSNFQRKMLNLGVLERKQKSIIKSPHKAPFLYSYKSNWTDQDSFFKS